MFSLTRKYPLTVFVSAIVWLVILASLAVVPPFSLAVFCCWLLCVQRARRNAADRHELALQRHKQLYGWRPDQPL